MVSFNIKNLNLFLESKLYYSLDPYGYCTELCPQYCSDCRKMTFEEI